MAQACLSLFHSSSSHLFLSRFFSLFIRELTLYVSERPSSFSEDEYWTDDFAKFGESAPAESAVVPSNVDFLYNPS